MNEWATDRQNMFVVPMSDKGIVSRISIYLLCFNYIKLSKLIKNWQNPGHFTKEGM